MHLAIILAICAGVRIWLMTSAEMISRDGTVYIQMARDWSDSGWEGVKPQTYHPGYPVAVSWLNGVLNMCFNVDDRSGWELSGQLVSLLFSLLGIAGLWCFAGMVFNWRIAFVSALLFGVSRKFAALGADVLSDSLALCFQIWAIVLAIRVLDILKGRAGNAFLSAALIGLLAAAAYLVKVEGLIVVVISALLLLTVKDRRARSAGLIAVMLLVCLLCMTPYMLAIGGLTAKKSISDFVMVTSHNGPMIASLAGVTIDSRVVFKFIGQLSEAVNPVLFFMAVILLADSAARKMRIVKLTGPQTPRFAGTFIMIAAICLLAPAVILQYYKHGFMSHRYFMFPAILIAPWAGAGVLLVAQRAGSLASRFVKLKPFVVEALIVSIAALGILGNSVKRPLHSGKGHMRQAGRETAKIAGERDKVFSNSRWVLHYAQRRGGLLDLQRHSVAEIAQAISTNQASGTRYLVLSEAIPGKWASGFASTNPTLALELVKRIRPHGNPKKPLFVTIYRVARQIGPGAAEQR
jgi:hypothetical protein